ncbi:hypothetical protein G7B40_025545 [Aetokthonos hydrillicola Thurmond2011]|uniref:Uncharacterized protein n=1 Tax=Aetokthonos hydrillicola Thurmond2011 TaxID=2712845 RepID=A0AAP5IAK0_9CYAN|nr:hypothetical protein [Aetokthonos hydrillicola]MBO3464105.1 hypothetical protein [Aetokthonos hydrillicola CCALA 1050]MBW4587718.1 hypothetical protein [Aetokthonos hydrillicola CCALA 1050]MDR9897901.1 hypothetical protein [Aetokthonos hydrillicola Thurmond2011]
MSRNTVLVLLKTQLEGRLSQGTKLNIYGDFLSLANLQFSKTYAVVL